MVWHITARTLLGSRPFIEPSVAWWFWRRMRETFPNAFVACLMPNHFHVLDGAGARELQARMRGLMSGLSRHVGATRLWERAPDPTPVRGPAHLARQIKYVHLNPCRAGLVRDALAWPWTTHRALVGAEADPWTTAARIAPVIHQPADGFERAFHAYVSDSSSVAREQAHFPRLAVRGVAAATPLPLIVQAAASVTPWAHSTERRNVTTALALQQGWPRTSTLAAAVGCDVRTLRKTTPVTRGSLVAAILALGDERLRLESTRLANPVKHTRERSSDPNR